MDRVKEIKRIGTRVAFLRSQLKWSQAQLAERAGLTTNSISRLENAAGNPGFETLLGVAEGFGIPITQLIQEDDLLLSNGERREFRRQLAENLIDKIDAMDEAAWGKYEEIAMTLRCLHMLGLKRPRPDDNMPDGIND